MDRRRVVFAAIGLVAVLVTAWLALRDRIRVEPSPAAPTSHAAPEPRPEPALVASEPLEETAATRVASTESVTSEASVRPASVWTVRGRVRDGERPVADARVRIDLIRSVEPTRLGEVATDGDGRFELGVSGPLGALSEIARSVASVRAEARKLGFRSGLAYQKLELLQPGPIEFEIELERAAAVRGRLVDRGGTPVARATVTLRSEEGGDDEFSSGEDGTFEAWIRRKGAHSLHAAKFDVGVALVHDLDLDPAIDREIGDVVLQGAGAIRGRAVFPDGSPVADLDVVAFSGSPSIFDVERGPPDDSDGEGLPRGRTRTDELGRFSIGGLRAGLYRVTARNAFTCEERGGAQEHEPGDDGVELVVERYRLRIHVIDDGGSPIPSAELVLRSPGRVATAMVFEEDGVHEVFGRPGEEWRTSANAPSCLPAEGTHLFEEGEYESELELTLKRHDASRGSLRFEFTTESAVSLEGGTLFLRTRDGSLVPHGYARELDADRRVDDLVPGKFEVHLLPGRPLVRAFHDSSWFFPVDTSVEIQANEETRVPIDARAGGRARLTVHVPAGSDASGLARAGLNLVKVREGADSLGPLLRQYEDGTAEYGADLVPDVPFVVMKLLEPGIHTLRLSAAGFQDLERTFTIRAGEYTDVDLALSSR